MRDPISGKEFASGDEYRTWRLRQEMSETKASPEQVGETGMEVERVASVEQEDRARLLRLVEGEVSPEIMKAWRRLDQQSQDNIISTWESDLEAGMSDKQELINRFVLLVNETVKFLKFDGPPSDAYIPKVPREEIKLRKEITSHLQEPRPSIDRLIEIMERKSEQSNKRPSETIQ